MLGGGSTARTLAVGVGARVERLSPICACSHDVAGVTFRLLRSAVVDVAIVRTGRRVATLVHDRLLPAGLQRFAWRGHVASGGRAPDGAYRPEVVFDVLHRVLVLPSSIVVDTRAPRLQRDRVRRVGRYGLRIGYRWNEPARTVLLVDGRRAAATGRARLTGVLAWDGPARRPAAYVFALRGVDRAGNRSLPQGRRVVRDRLPI